MPFPKSQEIVNLFKLAKIIFFFSHFLNFSHLYVDYYIVCHRSRTVVIQIVQRIGVADKNDSNPRNYTISQNQQKI